MERMYYVVSTHEGEPQTVHEELGGACLKAHDLLAEQLQKGQTGCVGIDRIKVDTEYDEMARQATRGMREKSFGAK